jgi:hypothetical protein
MHFFIAILILQQFYNAKKKKEFLLIFEAIVPISVCEDFLSIKTPHMHEYFLALQNLLVVICISYKLCTTTSTSSTKSKNKNKMFFFAFAFSFLRLIKQLSLLQSRTCSSRRNYIFARFRSKMC